MKNFYRAGRTKYKNKPKIVDGITFDSAKEARRYTELSLMEKAGQISNLQTQYKFTLIPVQREPEKVGKRGGIIKGKVLERECSYVADFVYFDTSTGKQIVEDTKGFRTKDYIIKRKLMLYIHGIQIKEI